MAASTTAKIGPCADHERTCTDRQNAKCSQDPLGAGSVNQGTPRHLASQGNKTASGQHEPDIALGPFLRGQINGHQGAEAHLRVCKEEDEPIESAQTAGGGGRKMTPRRGPWILPRVLVGPFVRVRFVGVRPGSPPSTIIPQGPSGGQCYFSGVEFSDFVE